MTPNIKTPQNSETAATSAPNDKPGIEIATSRQFPEWLAEQKLSLAFTTYQSGKLFLLGLQASGKLSVFERTFNRCMGLWSNGQTLWMSSLYQLWRFENALAPGELHQGYDRLYVPQVAYTTGDLDIHDLGVDARGRPVFVNTLFGCLATISDTHSFTPLWQPPFLSKLAAEDRCHLNGLAMENGLPRYMTSVSRTDVADGWREKRADGGCVIKVSNGQLVMDGGLSMPHSPRLHRGKLWLADSGSGRFGWVDTERGVFEEVAFCPGYIRGMAMVGDFAVVGLSRPRHNKTFSGLALDRALAQRGVEARCGLLVIDLRSGDIVHWLRLEGVVEELYDVVALPGVRCPMALGLVSDEIRRVLTVGEMPKARRAAAGS
jgi:uncharacterized protein (TIGR03032 family)